MSETTSQKSSEQPGASPRCAAATGSACYAQRPAEDLGEYYVRHVVAMTREGLHSKADIAAELAVRDREIDRLRAALQAVRDWYERDGSVGGCDSLMEEHVEPLTSSPNIGDVPTSAEHS